MLLMGLKNHPLGEPLKDKSACYAVTSIENYYIDSDFLPFYTEFLWKKNHIDLLFSMCWVYGE